MAAGGTQAITALLNKEITINYNGQAQSFQDAGGNAVYPITYNGTTYLPVRGVSNLVGLPIRWDGATNTVHLGSEEKQPTSLVAQANSGATAYNWIISDTDQFKFLGDSEIQEFTSGVAYSIWNNTFSSGKQDMYGMYFNVAGFNQLTFSFACEREVTIKIFDQDGNILSTSNYTGGIVTKTIKLDGATKISLQADGVTYENGTHKNAYFYNPTLS